MDDIDCADVWSIVLEQCATDTKGSIAVPALALVSSYRPVCKDIMRGAAGVHTPYDAAITFVSNGASRVPTGFCGGVHFSDPSHCSGFAILRDAPTSQMFAVSRGEGTWHKHTDGKWGMYYTVRRMYALARLAQLLGGHASEWSQRLPDLYAMALPFTANSLGSHVVRNVALTKPVADHPAHDGPVRAVVVKNQLRAREWTGEQGVLTRHDDDFITHRVARWEPLGNVKMPEFVMATSADHVVVEQVLLPSQFTWSGKDLTCMNFLVPPLAVHDQVHVLSRALGWDCTPHVAEGPGWLVSMLPDEHNFPTPLTMPEMLRLRLDVDQLREFCDRSKKSRETAERAKTLPYHPIKNPRGFNPHLRRRRGRGSGRAYVPRAAALVAKERMSSAPLTSESGSDGEDAEYVQPKRPKRHRDIEAPAAPDALLTTPKTVAEWAAKLVALRACV